MNPNEEIKVNKKSKAILIFLLILIIISAVATYYKLIVLQDFAVVPSEELE